MTEARLAARNVIRHPVRSAIALSAILFGIVALILSGGFIEWIFWAMREATVHSRLGHIQVAKSGYFSQGQDDFSAFILPNHSPEIALIESIPGIQLATSRLSFSGLISFGETTLSFVGEGVDPEKEGKISNSLTVFQGKDLSSKDPKGVILG